MTYDVPTASIPMHPSSGLNVKIERLSRLPFPNERKKWLALLENSARHVAKITNSSLRTGIIPSFETRSIECISSHPIDKTIADHH
jgi:hypothetical protein